MSLQLQTGLPSTRLLQTYLKEKTTIEAKLITGETITGTLAWQDPNCLCLNADDQSILVWRSALVFIKAV